MRHGATPDATRRQPRCAAAAAASRRSLTSSRPRSSRPEHTLVPVSTWNCISSCCTPGSPPSIRTRSGPAGTVSPVEGSRSTNSSSTPSVIAPAARPAPGRTLGTFASRPAPPDPGISTTTCCSGSGRGGTCWPSALAIPATAWAVEIDGHSSAASVMEAAACTAIASAPASVMTCPAAFRAASSGCSVEIGRVRAIVSSPSVVEDTPRVASALRRRPPGVLTNSKTIIRSETGASAQTRGHMRRCPGRPRLRSGPPPPCTRRTLVAGRRKASDVSVALPLRPSHPRAPRRHREGVPQPDLLPRGRPGRSLCPRLSGVASRPSWRPIWPASGLSRLTRPPWRGSSRRGPNRPAGTGFCCVASWLPATLTCVLAPGKP